MKLSKASNNDFIAKSLALSIASSTFSPASFAISPAVLPASLAASPTVLPTSLAASPASFATSPTLSAASLGLMSKCL